MRSNSFSSRDAIYSRDARRKKNCRLYDKRKNLVGGSSNLGNVDWI